VPSSHLVLGGARSGKSRFAVESLAARCAVTVVATAVAGDPDLAARIARHRAERPRSWTTVEEPLALAECLERLDAGGGAVLVDCLTVWAANRLLRGDADEPILAEARRIAALARRTRVDLTLVSNEVGEGVHPSTPEGLRFRDLLGLVNQEMAAACDRVTLMVAGLPVAVKTSGAVPPSAPREHAPEAP
jgi:adenosylcobinamide kinase/adenosylcobinamide-phosphate guanylyltransferase